MKPNAFKSANSLSIGITTFKRRLHLAASLVKSIRAIDGEIPIILTANADYGSLMDEGYRSSILSLCAGIGSLYPVVFPAFTGLSKMWNTIIVNSPTSHVLVLNDDLEVASGDFIEKARDRIGVADKSRDPTDDVFTLNGSWSHFCIGKARAHEVGYFDERLLAFGEEDGDFLWRFQYEYGVLPGDVAVTGIRNLGEGADVSDARLASEDRNVAFRPVFNRRLIQLKYRRSIWGHRGWFSSRMRSVFGNEQQYPYEAFKWRNYEVLGSGSSPSVKISSRARESRVRYAFLRLIALAGLIRRAVKKLNNTGRTKK